MRTLIVCFLLVAGTLAIAPVSTATGVCAVGTTGCVCIDFNHCKDSFSGHECWIAAGLSNQSYNGVYCPDSGSTGCSDLVFGGIDLAAVCSLELE